MKGHYGNSSKSPSTAVQMYAVDPKGQAKTMKGAAGGPHIPCPNQHLNGSKDIHIDPCSGMGAKGGSTSHGHTNSNTKY